MNLPVNDDDNPGFEYYVGQKNPLMPQPPVSTLPEDFAQGQTVSRYRATEFDFNFFMHIHAYEECIEFQGYNTKTSREQGYVLKPKTNVVYLPLIDTMAISRKHIKVADARTFDTEMMYTVCQGNGFTEQFQKL